MRLEPVLRRAVMVNLTELEQRAIDAPINLSDGHPRQELTGEQRKLVLRFPEIFEAAREEPFADVERAAHVEFLRMLGQPSAPVDAGRVFSVYSSSVATMVVGAVLADRGDTVALLHPTFDNIHDLLVRATRLVPVSEAECTAADLRAPRRMGARCLFVTTPNNPTGWFLDRDGFQRLAAECAETGMVLCVDSSFRGFDTRAQFDHYEILHRTGVSYILIEDTGKLWPVAELKLGFLVVSEDLRPAVEHVLSDVLLTVSPFLLKIIEALSAEGRDKGLDELHTLIAANRQVVAQAVAGLPGIRLADGAGRVSVSRLRFDTPRQAEAARLGLQELGVHVLPCQQFHWARPQEGATLVRLALARDTATVADAMKRLTGFCGATDWARR
ncbi:aminotransferase class I/II-fold pyridoxal phosphate-dependent enzyme [Nocardia pseudovaccinii]|uniref:aminotransferase class I/II-fold pyridoxal phosphate-dependent enzyme n=1 Tax=Nocardia pseudovaccinii TaxID=189540 RepID=UPI003D8BA31D